MGRIKLVMIIFGAVLIFVSAQELILASKTSATPKQITCTELIQNGPGDNIYLKMDGHVPCSNWYVYESANNLNNPDGPYSVVYLPAVPLGGPWHQKAIELYELYGEKAQFPAPKNIRILLKINNVRNPDHLGKILDRVKLKGMVINSVESIGRKEKSLLRQGYPNLNFDKCYIFEVDRKPANVGTQVGMLAGGLIFALAGLFWLIKPKLQKRKAAKVAAAVSENIHNAQPDELAEEQPAENHTPDTDDTMPPIDDDHKNPYA